MVVGPLMMLPKRQPYLICWLRTWRLSNMEQHRVFQAVDRVDRPSLAASPEQPKAQ